LLWFKASKISGSEKNSIVNKGAIKMAGRFPQTTLVNASKH